MKRELNQKEKSLYKEIARILWKEWDPICVYDENGDWNDEYDSYVPSILHLALENNDVYKISSHLTKLQSDNMGLSTTLLSNEYDKNIAELIIKAKQEIINNI